MLHTGEPRTGLSGTQGSRGIVDSKKLSSQQEDAFQNTSAHKARQPLAWRCLSANFRSALSSLVTRRLGFRQTILRGLAAQASLPSP